jgi:SAM-dependent methyltransferase
VSKTTALDLYAKVEDLLGVREASPKLYAYYFFALNGMSIQSLLDIGCGSGDFLVQINKAFHPKTLIGIDLSPKMVALSQAKGLDARVVELSELEGSFDVITAVFDMLNYLNDEQLNNFLDSVTSHLNDGGYFLCDVNTLFGFREVAVGSFTIDEDDRFLAIESDFNDDIYISEFTLFEKKATGYQKSKETIEQYYHSVEDIAHSLPTMKLIEREKVTLYLDKADKEFLVFQKLTP